MLTLGETGQIVQEIPTVVFIKTAHESTILKNEKEFPGNPEVRTQLSIPGAWVQSLVEELKSCKPRSSAKNKQQQQNWKKKNKEKRNIVK